MRRVPLLLLLASCKVEHTAPRVPPAGAVTFVARSSPRVLVLQGESPAAPLVIEGAGAGTLLVAAPIPDSPGEPVAAVPRVPDPVAIDEVTRSLSREGRSIAPEPAELPFYDVAVDIAPEAGSFRAQVQLDYPNRSAAALAELPLRLFANAAEPRVRVEELRVAGAAVPAAPSDDPTIVHVPLVPPVAPGAWVRLAYRVTGQVPISTATAGGSLASALLASPSRAPDYGLFARFPGGIALADWLPLAAARWNDGFDLGPVAPIGDTAFADVASFRASVDLPHGYRLVAPGQVLGQENLPGGRQRTRLALADARDLTLFASKGYETIERQDGRTVLQVAFERGHDVQARETLEAAGHALSALSARLGAYPWNRFTAVEVPLGGGAGGAEFSGLVAIAGMFFTPTAPVGFGLSLSGHYLDELREFTVTHEVAHQWWAIAVGSNPRLEPDVDEPLTQATAALVLSAGRGGAFAGAADRAELFDREVAVNYQAMRLLGAEDGPAARSTADFESQPAYAGLIYGKAPMLYEQLARELGDSAFWNGLRAYADAYRFKTAHRGDLARVLATHGLSSPQRLDALTSRWLEEAHGDEDLASRGDPMAAASELFSGSGGDSSEGSEALENLDPSQLAKAARAALSQAAAGKGDPQAGEAPIIDPAQAKQLLQQLDQTMGGADLP